MVLRRCAAAAGVEWFDMEYGCNASWDCGSSYQIELHNSKTKGAGILIPTPYL